MRLKSIVTVIFVLISASFASSEQVLYNGDQVWRVVPQSKHQLEVLRQFTMEINQVDVWLAPTNINKPVDFHIPSKELGMVANHFKQNGLGFQVLVSDVQKLIDDGNRRKRSILVNKPTNIDDFDYKVYHPLKEVEEWIDFLSRDFPSVTKFQIGVTYEGRHINALKVSTSNSTKPAIYIDSLIHSREWIATAAMLYVIKEILTNKEYSWMANELDWYFVPVVNADGYEYTWTTDRLWRKTKSEQATLRCIGVDANRNFNDHWSGPVGSSSEPCNAIFRGPFPESESENRHLARFISAHNDSIKALVTVHSYAQVILYPYNFAVGEYPPNNNEQNETARAMSEAMYKVHNTTYDFGPGSETLAVATGVTTDWSQAATDIDINLTIELRDTGTYGFVLPADQIIPTGEELLAGIVVLARHVLDRENKTLESP